MPSRSQRVHSVGVRLRMLARGSHDYGVTASAPRKLVAEAGANERNRTADLLITSELLYQLSYVGM